MKATQPISNTKLSDAIKQLMHIAHHFNVKLNTPSGYIFCLNQLKTQLN